MKKDRFFKLFEIILLTLVWLVLIVSPVLFNNNEVFEWDQLYRPLRTMVPLFFIFLINRFLLVPKLLRKKKNLIYIVSVVGLIGAFSYGMFLFGDAIFKPPPVEARFEERRQPPPDFREFGDGPPPPGQGAKGGRQIPPFGNLLIFSLLLVGFDTGLMTTFMLAKSERQRVKLEKENAESQLAFLRNQVSPHFFMNTLNNIHSLIDIDTDEAKDAVIQLSKLMRHLLYESEEGKIPLQKEIDFIKNYVDLMKLRYSDKVKITLSLPPQFPDKTIPPLLFTSYVENAFKHGISYQQDSFIDIQFLVTDIELTFEIRNSNPKPDKADEFNGIGEENSRKRLDLIFGNSYSLKIDDGDNEYSVHLSIPI